MKGLLKTLGSVVFVVGEGGAVRDLSSDRARYCVTSVKRWVCAVERVSEETLSFGAEDEEEDEGDSRGALAAVSASVLARE